PNQHKSAKNAALGMTGVALGEIGGRDVVAGAINGSVLVYDARTGKEIPELKVSASVVVAVALEHFDGRSILVTGSKGGVLAVWEADTGQRIAAVTLDSEITGVWVVRGASAVAARDKGGRLLVFDLIGGA